MGAPAQSLGGAGSSANRNLPVAGSIQAHIAFVHDAVFTELRGFYRANLVAGAAAVAFIAVYHYNAIFLAFADGFLRAGFNAARFNALQAGYRPEYPFHLRESTAGFFFHPP